MRLRAERTGEGVSISVHDHGIGIVPGRLPRVFEPFSRPKAVAAPDHAGMGIGLALVRGIIEGHGGRVEARSMGVGHGSEFIAWLPLRQPAKTPLALPARSPRLAAIEAARVLVVDAYSPAAESLAVVLRMQGHVVRVAHDGLAALATTDEFKPDIVILDIGPTAHGLEIARRIRARAGGERLVLVAVVNPHEQIDEGFASRARIDLQVEKPILRNSLSRAFALFGERNAGRETAVAEPAILLPPSRAGRRKS